MWQLIAIVLTAVLLFYWFAFMFSLWAWFQFIVNLCQLQFVRATIWFSLGSGMLFWWMGSDIDFDTWLHGSCVIVGMGALGTFLRWRKKQLATQAIPTMPTIPTWPTPSGNVVPFIKVKVERKRG